MPATVMSRFSYPKVPGDSLWSITDMTGPASYVGISIGLGGNPVTGGQLVTAADFGLQSLDFVSAMGSNSGQYSVTVFPAPFNPGNEMHSVRLQWNVASTGAQVGSAVNLSLATVRLFAVGR